jgi:hypothetical protein
MIASPRKPCSLPWPLASTRRPSAQKKAIVHVEGKIAFLRKP